MGRKIDIVLIFLDESEEWVILVIRFLYIFYFVSCDIILLLIVESVFEVVNVNLGCVLVCWNV